MAVLERVNSGLMSPIKGIKKVLSDGYYASSYLQEGANSPNESDSGATYIPDQTGWSSLSVV